LVVAFYCSPSRAQSAAEHADIVVEAAADHLALANDFSLSGEALSAGRLTTSDTASLVPGIESARNGGVSSFPIIRGLGDDRIRTLINGVPVAAACPMHMNPPLSYIDPTNVGQIDVYPGVTPVSLGGDNLGRLSRWRWNAD
jgi:iron complex outermembrane recepter protein